MVETPKGVHFSFNHNHDRLTAMLKLAEDRHGAKWATQLAKEADIQLATARSLLVANVAKNQSIGTQPLLANDQDELAVFKEWLSDDYRFEVYQEAYKSLDKEQFPLNEAQYMAIRYYTGSGYEKLNEHLNGLKAFDKARQVLFNEVTVLLNNALNKLPAYQGRVIRTLDLSDAQLAQYELGGVIEFPAFTSATYGKKAVKIGGDKNVKLIINQQTGRKIDKISHFAREKEVLLGSPTRYKVERRIKKKDYIEIELTEIINE